MFLVCLRYNIFDFVKYHLSGTLPSNRRTSKLKGKVLKMDSSYFGLSHPSMFKESFLVLECRLKGSLFGLVTNAEIKGKIIKKSFFGICSNSDFLGMSIFLTLPLQCIYFKVNS